MEQKVKDNIYKYAELHKNKIFALKNWINLNNKSFKLLDALYVLYEYSDGNFNKLTEIIEELTKYEKKYRLGSTAYGENKRTKPDIVVNNGKLELVGFKGKTEDILKGQHTNKNNNIFRTSDNQVSKTYQNTQNKLMDLGVMVRELYPSESNAYITSAIRAIRRYSANKKISPKKVVDGIKNNRLIFDEVTDEIILNKTNESKNNKVIIIDESIVEYLKENTNITEYSFYANVKDFLSKLLSDPINAKPSITLRKYGLNRNKLIHYLISNKILDKENNINDKDENGNPKTATMKVKYKVPKSDFKHKLKKLYIKLFEKNIPDKLNEEGECCGATNSNSSGEFVQPIFSIQRRNFNK